ncbi:protein suppressor of sable isoform X1 [Vanessa tameamea]|uniref:Protein suppressor of sable isoform X1 n=2 Tax=Vanessa tameamea TaxID=334116 RepID=A0A8B8IVF2_VANTA|nr:protein suppressor of sable isoform X1 [Vanessa tameamea]
MTIVSTNISENIIMADPVATNTDDLEDGEIESDGEETNEVTTEVKKEESVPDVEGTRDQDKTDNQNFYHSKSGKKKKSKSSKSEKSKDKSKKSRKYTDSVEDDFAGNIEKAIRKAMNKAEGGENQAEEDVEERRKHKKRKKYDGKEGPSKKRKKQEYSDEMDESEMMCVRGASPVQKKSPDEMYQDDDRESYDSDSSQDSRGHHAHRQRHRPPQRVRNKNKNDRRRETHPMQDPDGVCLYYMQGKCHKGDDCIYSHDAQPPRKMELCKFYLMDCCAKRDKCLYMHADFPCKYYHTGLPCIYKDECKFAHGKPLNDSLKNILLKHIESAPKEILGDFPRLNREGALKMIQTTQLKLMQQFSENNDNQVRNIPSLFDLNIPNPQSNPDLQMHQYNNERQNKISPKVRQSRWQNDHLSPNANSSPNSSNVGNTNVLSIKNLTGVLTPRQISDLTKMGIENLDQLGQLTVLQLNSIGISLKQITEIQLNTMSIQKLGLINNIEQQSQFGGPNTVAKDLDLRVPPAAPSSNSLSMPTELPGQDVDMRFQPNVTHGVNEDSSNNKIFKKDTNSKDMIDIDQYTKDALKFATKDKENIDISNESLENEKVHQINEVKDVDHRVLPFTEGDTSIRRPNIEESLMHTEGDTDIRFLQPEPIFKNPEKSTISNRRSTTDDEEDNNLLIDEKWYSSDEEKGNKKKSPHASPHNVLMSPPDPAPSVIEPSAVLSKLGDLSKIDISEEVTKLLNTMKNNLQDNKTSTSEIQEQIISRDPRSRRSPVKTNEISKPASKKSSRVSIYECIDGEPTDGRRRTDVDLRQTNKPSGFGDTDLRQGTSGDIDLRLGLPFKPLPNYTPASEINGSINSHPPIQYKMILIHIPRPDYTDIKNSIAKSQALTDPRLRKVFRLSVEESNSDSEKSSKVVNTAPRVDPRRKPKDSIENITEQKSNSLELQTILQNSNWYKELSSTQKIFVNQHLAPVTQMIKQFQQEKLPGKKFDLTSIQSNTVLCNVFTNLGISLGENGEFAYLPKPKEALLKTPINFNQNSNPFSMNNNMPGGPGAMEGNMNMMNIPPMGMGGIGGMNNMNHMHGFNQSLPDPRGGPAPGLLGIAPNIPHNFNNNKFGGPHNFGNMGYNGPPGNDFNYMEGDQNFQRFPNRGGGHRGRGNDRWNRGGSGRGHRDRKNFNERGNWKNDRH